MADRIGWIRRHLGSQFTAEVGIGPKDASCVLRFDRARTMKTASPVALADVAVACDHADQPHLNREFRTLADASPRQWLIADDVARLSARGGLTPEDLRRRSEADMAAVGHLGEG